MFYVHIMSGRYMNSNMPRSETIPQYQVTKTGVKYDIMNRFLSCFLCHLIKQ